MKFTFKTVTSRTYGVYLTGLVDDLLVTSVSITPAPRYTVKLVSVNLIRTSVRYLSTGTI